MYVSPENKANLKEVTMSNRDEIGTFAIGFLVGGLTAAVVALLFAPQSGEETRELIKEKTIELRDQAQQTAEEAMARAEAIAKEARTRGDELTRQILKGQKQGTAPTETPEGKPTAV
jgi:gas vesicle protein